RADGNLTLVGVPLCRRIAAERYLPAQLGSLFTRLVTGQIAVATEFQPTLSSTRPILQDIEPRRVRRDLDAKAGDLGVPGKNIRDARLDSFDGGFRQPHSHFSDASFKRSVTTRRQFRATLSNYGQRVLGTNPAPRKAFCNSRQHSTNSSNPV